MVRELGLHPKLLVLFGSGCGQHTDPISLKRSKRWCEIAYDKFKAMALDPELSTGAGVKMRMTKFFFVDPVLSSAQQVSFNVNNFKSLLTSHQTRKMREIASHVDGFRHSADIISESGVNANYSPAVVDAYEHLAPVVDTDQYMYWICNRALSLGATLLTERIHGSLIENESALLGHFSAAAIVNCTGLAASELAEDHTCHPLRGALV
jgi:hypothetical protein